MSCEVLEEEETPVFKILSTKVAKRPIRVFSLVQGSRRKFPSSPRSWCKHESRRPFKPFLFATFLSGGF